MKKTEMKTLGVVIAIFTMIMTLAITTQAVEAYCSNCGQTIEEDDNFCSSCGVEQVSDEVAETQSSDELTEEEEEIRWQTTWMLVAVVVAVFMMAMPLFLR